MDQFWRWWPLTLSLLSVCGCPHSQVLSPKKMSDFISQMEQLEEGNPGLDPLSMLRALRAAANHSDEVTLHFLGGGGTSRAIMAAGPWASLGRALQHTVREAGQEEGVVLTPDGTTVALSPVLLGLEAGLQAKIPGWVRGLYQLTLARSLGLSFKQRLRYPHVAVLGPNGCWDSMESPQVFTLTAQASGPTEALVNGAMDGLVLGLEMSEPSSRPTTLSGLLKSYYSHHMEEGLDGAPHLVSPRRRENFREMVRPPLLQRQVVRSLALQRRLLGQTNMGRTEKVDLAAVVKEGMEEFVHRYMDCPAIILRCQWGAESYRGTPTMLTLPLSFLYIHHTHEPGKPCLSFQQCSRDMRAMQRFHQEDRGWDDIGYSFVVGSDGYLYEGRGWHWQGAHTKGHNSRGYGVSFIGDYASTLPGQGTMDLLRERLTSCAVGGGRLVPNYTLHGHRQLVNTSCPGDALYSEITGWKHFREVQQ